VTAWGALGLIAYTLAGLWVVARITDATVDAARREGGGLGGVAFGVVVAVALGILWPISVVAAMIVTRGSR
jgi:hypothetical protein